MPRLQALRRYASATYLFPLSVLIGCASHREVAVTASVPSAQQTTALHISSEEADSHTATRPVIPASASRISDTSPASAWRKVDTSPASGPALPVIAQASGAENGGMPSLLSQPQPSEPGSSQLPPVQEPKPEKPLPTFEPAQPEDRYPINLATAFRLAGANNLQIALAAERVLEASARLEGAEALWLPSINAGVGYNKHDGRLQETEGNIIEVSRNSLFVGGGSIVGLSSLAGGASGPTRLGVDLSLADAFFEPLAARQLVRVAQADEEAVFNDTLLQVAVTYFDLVQAQSEVAIAQEAAQHAEELVRVAEEFAGAGIGLEADVERARAERANRHRELLAVQETVEVVSAELARLLRLDPAVTLFAADRQPVPLQIVKDELDLRELIAQAVANRPELRRQEALVQETLQRLRQERLRPWLPNVHVGFGAGGFGGGASSFFGNFSDRTDFDALAVWELQNLGFGNRALQRTRLSQHQQASLTAEEIQDLIAAEVSRAYHQVRYRQGQIEQARSEVEAAAEALPLNFEGIRGGVLRVIESQQAIAALSSARSGYLSAVVDYNRAQFQLLRALGQPPTSPSTN